MRLVREVRRYPHCLTYSISPLASDIYLDPNASEHQGCVLQDVIYTSQVLQLLRRMGRRARILHHTRQPPLRCTVSITDPAYWELASTHVEISWGWLWLHVFRAFWLLGRLSIRVSVCLKVCLSVCLSICLSVYVSVCLSLSFSVSASAFPERGYFVPVCVWSGRCADIRIVSLTLSPH